MGCGEEGKGRLEPQTCFSSIQPLGSILVLGLSIRLEAEYKASSTLVLRFYFPPSIPRYKRQYLNLKQGLQGEVV